MALLWFDGFESYSSAQAADYLTQLLHNSLLGGEASVGGSAVIGSAYGRNGNGYRMDGHEASVNFDFANNYTSFIYGIAVKQGIVGTPAYHATGPFLTFYDGTTVQLRFHAVGTEIHVYNGAGAKLGETSGAGIIYNTWRYLEFKVTIDNSAGVVIIRSNENVVLNLSSQDTQYSGNAYFNILKRTGFYSNIWGFFDDEYMLDLTGGAPHNDFLGDIRVDALRPNGAGTYTDFTPSAGSNYQNVDEIYPDDDTTYNDGSNVADQDSYALGDLPSPAGTTIYGVKSQITVRKTDAGARQCKLLTRAGTTDDLGDAIALSDTFTTHTKIFEDNPDDSADWEDADVNGMEVGVEITSVSSSSSLSSSSSSSSSSA